MKYSDKDFKDAEKIYRGSYYGLSDKKALEKLLFAKNVYQSRADEQGGPYIAVAKELGRLVSTYKSQMGIEENVKNKIIPMKMTLRSLMEEIDPKANASANAVLLMDKLRSNPQFMQMLNQIQLPTDKYKAIQKFADLLGVPDQRFIDFCQQQENIIKQNQGV